MPRQQQRLQSQETRPPPVGGRHAPQRGGRKALWLPSPINTTSHCRPPGVPCNSLQEGQKATGASNTPSANAVPGSYRQGPWPGRESSNPLSLLISHSGWLGDKC